MDDVGAHVCGGQWDPNSWSSCSHLSSSGTLGISHQARLCAPCLTNWVGVGPFKLQVSALVGHGINLIGHHEYYKGEIIRAHIRSEKGSSEISTFIVGCACVYVCWDTVKWFIDRKVSKPLIWDIIESLPKFFRESVIVHRGKSLSLILPLVFSMTAWVDSMWPFV